MISFGRAVGEWFDDRAGVRMILQAALYEPIPGGSRWRYVWGSTLVAAFLTQAVTGVFLWMAYSPSTQTAWESVFYIQHEMTGGWLLRGIHHYMASAMVVLLALHFLQVVWDGAYRAPRELNFVLGLLLMLIVLALALTGYLLPWDQKGYWATSVGTNLASQAPLAGPEIKKLAIGGSAYGHLTLTRFFALHAGVLPGLLMVLLVLHVALFRRHGIHARLPHRGDEQTFWPDQVLKDSVAALAVLATVLGLTVYFGGAELMAPADPANPYDAARPEWYFLFLFQFLKWFPGEREIWGAFIIPGLVLVALFAMPWVGRSRVGHVFNVALLCVLLGGATLLTAQAIYDDYQASWTTIVPGAKLEGDLGASQRFLEAKRQAEREAERVIELAKGPERIPPEGALAMSYDDPLLQGPRLFAQHCAACHNLAKVDENGGADAAREFVNPKPTAPNLFGVGTEGWISGLLDPQQVAGAHYFGYEGSTFAEGEMATFVKDTFGEEIDDEQKATAKEAFAKIAVALSQEAALPGAPEPGDEQQTQIEEGVRLMTGGLAEVLDGGISCTDCHRFHDTGDLGSAPDLTGYMSREWMIAFIRNPAAERFYGDKNDRMPAFAPHDDPRLNQLDEKSIGLIVDWLRGDWLRTEPAVAEEKAE
jgi:ubiquinol-cytochrome c reductase cytochrome b subunit